MTGSHEVRGSIPLCSTRTRKTTSISESACCFVIQQQCMGDVKMKQKRKPYDKCIFHVNVDSEKGDKIRIQFPVGAVKKILKASGKLPLPQETLQEIDLSELMDAVAACLSEEAEGDFVTVETAGGTHVRVFVAEK